MDAMMSETEEQPIVVALSPSLETLQLQVRCECNGANPGDFPLAATPSVVLHVLTACNVEPRDLANLEATCSFFRQPANMAPDNDLYITELAAYDLCYKRAVFRPMTTDQQANLKKMCGGSWKLVLRYLLDGEACSRREKSQAIAGPGYSIAVTSKGAVYSFGSDACGQLGHGTTQHDAGTHECIPRQIGSLQGVRIIQAAAGLGRVMLVSDAGRVYQIGKEVLGEFSHMPPITNTVNAPRVMESLEGIFVVQVSIGQLFTAVLSREGTVYTMSWGRKGKLGHLTDPSDLHPHPILGELEGKMVVQIAAGYCYLLALAWEPSGMSVYSIGCGLGGKLGHGSVQSEIYPRLIEKFKELNLQPRLVSAGAWHAAVMGADGRVCTWGWGNEGCLGHGDEDHVTLPKVVEALSEVKAVHVSTGEYTTFVVADDGKLYSFGYGGSLCLGHADDDDDDDPNDQDAVDGDDPNDQEQQEGEFLVLKPKQIASMTQVREKVVQMSSSNASHLNAHTFALTESGKLYAFGSGELGQLGVKLEGEFKKREKAMLIDIDLS